MHSDNSLYIDSVTYSINGLKILDGIYFEMQTKSVVGLLGANGSGKSTLLNVIFGNRTPYSAFMKCNGILFKKGYKTGNIALLPQTQLLPRRVKLKTILKLFHFIDNTLYGTDIIKSNLNNYLSNLSGGDVRIIETLIILYSKPCFCLLDEPFTGLSPLSIEFIKEHIDYIKDKKGILISDHHYRDIMDISDRIVLLRGTKLLNVVDEEDLAFHGYIPEL